MEGSKPILDLSVEVASISESMELLIAKLVAEYYINDSNTVLIFDSVSSLRISFKL